MSSRERGRRQAAVAASLVVLQEPQTAVDSLDRPSMVALRMLKWCYLSQVRFLDSDTSDDAAQICEQRFMVECNTLSYPDGHTRSSQFDSIDSIALFSNRSVVRLICHLSRKGVTRRRTNSTRIHNAN